jgi:hypothetical protein
MCAHFIDNMIGINPKKPFKYNYYDRRFSENIIIVKEMYRDNCYDLVPKELYYILLRFMPLEIIGMIWNIKIIIEDVDFHRYIDYIHSPHNYTVTKSMRLRSGKHLCYNNTHIGIFCNSLNSLSYDKNIKKAHIIEALHYNFLKWYEYLKHNNNTPNFKKLINIMELKINEFYTFIVTQYNTKRNDIWYNYNQKNSLFLKIKDCKYFIYNYNCITSSNPCYNCQCFDAYVNLNDYSKKKSFFEYFPQYRNYIHVRDDYEFYPDYSNPHGDPTEYQADSWGWG